MITQMGFNPLFGNLPTVQPNVRITENDLNWLRGIRDLPWEQATVTQRWSQNQQTAYRVQIGRREFEIYRFHTVVPGFQLNDSQTGAQIDRTWDTGTPTGKYSYSFNPQGGGGYFQIYAPKNSRDYDKHIIQGNVDIALGVIDMIFEKIAKRC